MGSELWRTCTAYVNIYLIVSYNVIQVLGSDKPISQTLSEETEAESGSSFNGHGSNALLSEVARVQEIQHTKLPRKLMQKTVPESQLSQRNLNQNAASSLDFEPSPQVGEDDEEGGGSFGQRIRLRGKGFEDGAYRGARRDVEEGTLLRGARKDVGGGQVPLPQRIDKPTFTRPPHQYGNYYFSQDGIYDGELQAGQDGGYFSRKDDNFYSRPPAFDIRNPQNSQRQVYQYPYTGNQRQDDRFPVGGRPSPSNYNQFSSYSDDSAKPAGIGGGGSGLFGAIASFLRPSPPKKKVSGNPNEPSYEFIQSTETEDAKISFGNSISSNNNNEVFVPGGQDDYDEFNINYSDEGNSNDATKVKNPQYTLKDVFYSIRNNESRIETFKKFLSAASGLTNRAGTDPSLFMFSAPLAILSILGAFYAVSAIAVLAYKYILFASGSSNGAALAILPVAAAIIIPLLLVAVFLVVRGGIDGKISLSRLARGDVNGAFVAFDPVDFAYDALMGSTALLGLGWVVSVVL